MWLNNLSLKMNLPYKSSMVTVVKFGSNVTLELFVVRVTLKTSEPSRRRSSRMGIVTV